MMHPQQPRQNAIAGILDASINNHFINHLCVMASDQRSKMALKDLLKVTCAYRSVIAV